MRALVCTYRSAGDRIALAAVRALGKQGIYVTLGSDSRNTPSFWSRYNRRRIRLPSPILDPDRFAHAVRAEAELGRVDTVLPTDDYAVYALSKSHGEIPWPIDLPVPPIDVYLTAQDKYSAARLAKDLGIRVPRTALLDSKDGIRSVLSDFGFPVVIKLARGNGAVGLCIARSEAEVDRYSSGDAALADPVFDFSRLIVQEFVPGETHDLCALFRHGRPRAAMTSRRLLTIPPEGGAGIYNETTDRRDIRDQGIAILERLGWHGPAQVEFKVDARDGTPTFIEVNGRLWGTLALAIHAGIDIPTMACRMAVDGDVEGRFGYPVGLRFRWPLPNGLRFALQSVRAWKVLSELLGPGAVGASDIELLDPGPTIAILLSGRWLPFLSSTNLSPLAVQRTARQRQE